MGPYSISFPQKFVLFVDNRFGKYCVVVIISNLSKYWAFICLGDDVLKGLIFEGLKNVI
jgi:hypothetical protein